ncbi:MAG: hypothetical protein KDD15_23710, partial [Lewinella sp.]|nr:hypothetical protein [Lewinella sp.]
ELLWREFPTDQRGTYFHKFWDARDRPGQAGAYQDISNIHSWGKTLLGAHPAANKDTQPLVFVLRADLVRRYPDLIVHMSKAKRKKLDSGQIIREPDAERVLYPLFHAKITDDILCLGFDIAREEARSDPGWFFILKQRPGSLQFGLDAADPAGENIPALNTWDDLDWAHLLAADNYVDLERDHPTPPETENAITWGETAAHMAWITYQKPFQLAIHAKTLLAKQNPES